MMLSEDVDLVGHVVDLVLHAVAFAENFAIFDLFIKTIVHGFLESEL